MKEEEPPRKRFRVKEEEAWPRVKEEGLPVSPRRPRPAAMPGLTSATYTTYSRYNCSWPHGKVEAGSRWRTPGGRKQVHLLGRGPGGLEAYKVQLRGGPQGAPPRQHPRLGFLAAT